MLEFLKEKFSYPSWADERYKRLAFLDAILAGDLFKTLKGSFFDDTTNISTGRKAKLTDRRPSARFNLARMVGRQTARKLFSGRHAPRFMHPKNEKLALAAEALMREGFLKTRILQAVTWGSVGSVAIQFCVRDGGEGIPRIVFNVYRARMCYPTLDSLGELKSLRLWYVISPQDASALSTTDFLGAKIKDDSTYWFVRDFLPGREVTYVPVEVGSEKDGVDLDSIIQTMALTPIKELDYLFDPKIVCAHWFVNLAGGEFPDGASTWEDAIPGMIEIAFTLSQLGRGVRYNATPQLVTIGQPKKTGGPYAPGQPRISRDAAQTIELSAESEEPGGKKEGRGDAKLLEMKGMAVKAGLEYCERIRKYSLEQIGASRKDPDRLHFPQSGKAMELLDEDFFDLVGELRTCYGDYGVIPLMKKAIMLAASAGHPLLKGVSLGDLDELTLKWPRPYQPTAQEIQLFAQALNLLRQGPQGAKGADGVQAASAPGTIDRDEAHEMLDEFMDTPSKTTSVALQQQPRNEEDGRVEPAKPNGESRDLLKVQPQGKELPPRTTSLNPPPYHQQ
jgi:hypothetical protein